MALWRKPVAIFNPRAAGGKAEKRLPEVSRCLRERLGSVEVRRTERGGHATQLAHDALKAGADLVIAVGGDGTANEVVNGFFENGPRGSARSMSGLHSIRYRRRPPAHP